MRLKQKNLSENTNRRMNVKMKGKADSMLMFTRPDLEVAKEKLKKEPHRSVKKLKKAKTTTLNPLDVTFKDTMQEKSPNHAKNIMMASLKANIDKRIREKAKIKS